MHLIEIAFWLAAAIVFYTYLGYPILLCILTRFISKRKNEPLSDDELPQISHLIAAYNEEDVIEEKIQNALSSDYPNERIQHIIVADGSTDKTIEITKNYPEIRLFYEPERRGKLAAISRVLLLPDTDIVFFSDANAMLNSCAFRQMVRHFEDEKTGVVSGEKVVKSSKKDDASSAGEGLYWKYESSVKYWESNFYTTIGAVGELFAIRKSLYESPDPNTLTEDFVISMKIAQKGYKIVYEPSAKALEKASANIAEELKRKVRISAGGLQAIWQLRDLLNPFKYGLLSFQFFSHRVLRLIFAPLSLILLLGSNLFLALYEGPLYSFSLAVQIVFYSIAFVGFVLRHRRLHKKILFIPFYFTLINLCVFLGFFRLIKGDYSVKWERARRKV